MHLAFSLLLAGLTACQTPEAAPPPRDSLPAPAMAFINSDRTVADYLSCLRSADVTLVAAHRGGPGPGYPENALETSAHTLANGPMLLELDIRQTRDGRFALMHDETLERTTTGTGQVRDRTLAEIQALSLEDNDGGRTLFHPPSLEEALDWGRSRAMLQLDVKPGDVIDDVARIVVAKKAQPYTAVIAYTEDDALRAAAIAPDLTVTVEIPDIETLDRLEAEGLPANRIMAWTGIETEHPDLWKALHARGVSTAWGAIWYIDYEVKETGDPAPFARLANSGLDIVSTDLPEIAYSAIAATQDASAAVQACNEARP